MSSFRPSLFLRNALIIDAVASGATGALVLFGAGALADRLGLPATLLRGAGLVLVPYVAYVAWLAARRELTAAAVWLVIATNAAWTVASLVLLVGGWVAPTALGYAFVIAQAVVVAALGECQHVGLRRPVVTGRTRRSCANAHARSLAQGGVGAAIDPVKPERHGPRSAEG